MFVFLCASPRSQLLQLKKEKLEYIPGEHEHGLFPAPIHVGMSKEMHVTLPPVVDHLFDMPK